MLPTKISDPERIQARVIRMYEQHPFPSIGEKRGKTESEMALRLCLLGVTRDDYVGRRVLDAGCGTGEYSCWYASQGAHVTAVDLSGPSLRAAADYARREGLVTIEFQSQSVLDLNYPDESFDYVSCMGVLHHTPDPYRGFRELCRVLRPGGVLIVSLYNRSSRAPHNLRQAVVRHLVGDDMDRRVALARRLFPRTCRALQRNRAGDGDVILYDAFAIPHESRHSIGEVLGWFDRNGLVYQGAFGPITLRDHLRALALLRLPQFQGFKRFFDGFPLARGLVGVLPRLVPGGAAGGGDAAGSASPPSVLSRGLVQLAWLFLGFRFSIFSLSGRKPARTPSVAGDGRAAADR
jgi:ubiquinone/menaquinone biosynthesis C-methylase UbiE